jgi:hypothetical protein
MHCYQLFELLVKTITATEILVRIHITQMAHPIDLVKEVRFSESHALYRTGGK